MRRRRSAHLVVLVIALVALAVSDAVSQPSFPASPPPGQVVSDTAKMISGEHAAEIARIAAAVRTEKGYPIGVVTIRSLAAQGAGSHTIERYAAELLQSWRPDEPMRTHGLLLLVSADNRAARIQLGSAWGNAHDERARKVMDRLILPALRSGDVSKGILDGVRGFDAMSRQLPLPAVGRPSWMPSALIVEGLDDPWWLLFAVVAAGIVLVVGLVAVAKGGRRSWAWAAGAFVFALLLSRFFGGSAEASESEGGATGEY